MPIALNLSLERRMILRPEPPRWPCSGCVRSAGELKCSSKSLLRMSMALLSEIYFNNPSIYRIMIGELNFKMMSTTPHGHSAQASSRVAYQCLEGESIRLFQKRMQL